MKKRKKKKKMKEEPRKFCPQKAVEEKWRMWVALSWSLSLRMTKPMLFSSSSFLSLPSLRTPTFFFIIIITNSLLCYPFFFFFFLWIMNWKEPQISFSNILLGFLSKIHLWDARTYVRSSSKTLTANSKLISYYVFRKNWEF